MRWPQSGSNLFEVQTDARGQPDTTNIFTCMAPIWWYFGQEMLPNYTHSTRILTLNYLPTWSQRPQVGMKFSYFGQQ